jgi:hypothetical protein
MGKVMRKQFAIFKKKKIIFSDEAHFQLDGYVNTQNCRIWGAENPPVIHEKPLHAQRVTVWRGFWDGGVIGPCFFENEAGNAVTVNGVCYRIIKNYLLRYFSFGCELWNYILGKLVAQFCNF